MVIETLTSTLTSSLTREILGSRRRSAFFQTHTSLSSNAGEVEGGGRIGGALGGLWLRMVRLWLGPERLGAGRGGWSWAGVCADGVGTRSQVQDVS